MPSFGCTTFPGDVIIEGNPLVGQSGNLTVSGTISGNVSASTTLATGASVDLSFAERGRLAISAREFGVVPDGSDVSSKLQQAIDTLAPLGRPIRLPGAADGERYVIGSTITMRTGAQLIGELQCSVPGAEKTGVNIRRSGNFEMFVMDGAGSFLTNPAFKNIRFDGNGQAANIMRANWVGNLRIEDCRFSGATGGRAFLGTYIQDSQFLETYFQNCGKNDGTIGVVELDDSTGTGSNHIQNIRFDNCTWEANLGYSFLAQGTGTGPGVTLIHFKSAKFENLSSNWGAIRLIDADSVIMVGRSLIVTEGTASNTIPSQIYCTRTNRAELHWDAAHTPGGASLASLAHQEDCTTTDMFMYPADAPTVDNLTAAHLVELTGTVTNPRVRSTYTGTKKLLENDVRRTEQQSVLFDNSNSTAAIFARDGGTNANTSVEFLGGNNGSIWFGKDAAGRFAVAGLSDLSSPLFTVTRQGAAVLNESATASPSALTGRAQLFVTTAGELKVTFANGTTKTIATNI